MNLESNKLYPLKFKPILKQKLWGGDKIQPTKANIISQKRYTALSKKTSAGVNKT